MGMAPLPTHHLPSSYCGLATWSTRESTQSVQGSQGYIERHYLKKKSFLNKQIKKEGHFDNVKDVNLQCEGPLKMCGVFNEKCIPCRLGHLSTRPQLVVCCSGRCRQPGLAGGSSSLELGSRVLSLALLPVCSLCFVLAAEESVSFRLSVPAATPAAGCRASLHDGLSSLRKHKPK